MATLKKNIRGFVDNGALPPRRGYSESMTRPKIIKNERLSPTDRTILSVSPSLFSFKIWRISSPGIMEKKVNPRACLRTGIFRSIERSVMTRNIRIKAINLLLVYVFSNSLMLVLGRKLA